MVKGLMEYIMPMGASHPKALYEWGGKGRITSLQAARGPLSEVKSKVGGNDPSQSTYDKSPLHASPQLILG